MSTSIPLILSVDWDWFFPPISEFDWGHQESGSFFLEGAWAFRAGNSSLIDSSKIAVEAVRPDPERLDGFWERTVRGLPLSLVIAESHKDLYTIVEMTCPRGARIVNLDAHHDAGYFEGARELDCGNWAQKLHERGLLKEYTVVYPPWSRGKRQRDVQPVGFKSFRKTIVPPRPARYDLVYICRSGAWTPTWCDVDWTKFIEWWKTPFGGIVWENKTAVPYALAERHPNLAEAEELARKMRIMLKMTSS